MPAESPQRSLAFRESLGAARAADCHFVKNATVAQEDHRQSALRVSETAHTAGARKGRRLGARHCVVDDHSVLAYVEIRSREDCKINAGTSTECSASSPGKGL